MFVSLIVASSYLVANASATYASHHPSPGNAPAPVLGALTATLAIASLLFLLVWA